MGLCARGCGVLSEAQFVCAELEALYRGREELRWEVARFAEQKPEIFDANGVMEVAARALLSPLDRLAEQNIEVAARQVTTLTALMPLALVDVIATGAVAIGDDLIGSVAGGSVLTKFSRKFGEGVINGALTARLGVAAMQLCRPFAFQAGASPSVMAS